MGVRERITGFHFPAWAPVAFIIVLVFGILGILFYTRQASAAPHIGDHWHAAYAIYIGNTRQPNIPTFTGPEETHTHGDGMIHMHPFITAGEGRGSALGKFFEYGGGELSDDSLKVPGQKDAHKNGDQIDGKTAELRILRADSGIHPLGGDFARAIQACDAKDESAFKRVDSRYVAQDGDCIRIVFAAPEVKPVVQSDRTIISPDQATREIIMDVTGADATTAFTPAAIEVKAGETVKVTLTNKSIEAGAFHGVRFSGADRQYGTSDDFVTDPPTLDPGQKGTAVIRFDAPGEYEFKDEAPAKEGVAPATGKVVVGQSEATPAPTATAAPGATPTPAPADVTLALNVSDTGFDPPEITAAAGKSFRITVTNTGAVVHNLRIAGPDGQFRTDDDIAVSGFVNPGASGEASGKIDAPGRYPFRDDFNPTLLAGTLIIQ
jgi:plastocyanin